MNEPAFLSLDHILKLHELVILQFGGAMEIRDLGLIESALASAMNTYHYANGDLFDIAAAYAYHISESQAFLDGSKRTGLNAALTFLGANGMDADFDSSRLYDLMMDVANHRLDKVGLAEALREMALSFWSNC